MNIIGLSAKMACGKTTISDIIIKETGGLRLAFGDALKEECATYFGFPISWCYSQEGKMKVIGDPEGPEQERMTVREALQWYGTDFRRAQDPAYWIKRMKQRLFTLGETNPSLTVVIDDVRFPDEAWLVKAHGLIFRINPHPLWQPGPHAGHESETALDKFPGFDKVYQPGYGMEALGQVAQDILNTIKG